jgi:hypothetical protein
MLPTVTQPTRSRSLTVVLSQRWVRHPT